MAKKQTVDASSELSVEEVFDVLQFTRELVYGQMYPGAITPQLLSASMKNISFLPAELTEAQLNEALQNPKDSEEALRQFMEHLELVSMPMKRILAYMLSHLAFDITYTAKGMLEEKDYKSPSFKKAKAAFYDFLDNFDYKGQFKNAVKQMLRNETYVFTVRDDKEKVVLQELPLDRCLITGRWDYGFLVSFDFAYFLQPGVDIRLYPKFFREKYRELFSGKENQYIPSLNPSGRGGLGSRFAYWIDLPPDIAWVFKFDTSLAVAIPYFSGLMPELIQQPTMRALQKNVSMAAASRMLLGQVPMRKEGTKTSVRDMISIDATTLGKFLALVQSAVSEAIKVASAPLEDMQKIEFSAENELYDSYLQTSVASSGMNSALFYTSKLKANAIESQLSFQSDSKIMESLYSQFNLCMEWLAKKRTEKHKVVFLPKFEGNDYYLDRENRFDKAMRLADKGIVLPQKISAAIGMQPQELERQMLQAKVDGFVESLTPIVSSFNMPAEGAGRPKKTDGEIEDSGLATREQGANVSRGGKE